MDNRIKIGIIIVGFLIVGIIIAFFLGRKKEDVPSSPQTQTEQPEATFPKADPKTLPVIHGTKPALDAEQFEITTHEGAVSVKNVYKMPDSVLLAEDGTNFKNTKDYYMAYYPGQQGFLLVIMDQDVESARVKLETDFLDFLGISKEQACKLNVSLTVAPETDSPAVGGNYGLSFCPSGKPLRTK